MYAMLVLFYMSIVVELPVYLMSKEHVYLISLS
jgi:hypothetical protein